MSKHGPNDGEQIEHDHPDASPERDIFAGLGTPQEPAPATPPSDEQQVADAARSIDWTFSQKGD